MNINSDEIIKKYETLEDIRMSWTISTMAAMVLNEPRKEETDSETFDRTQKEFVCSLLQLGISLELVQNGVLEYQEKIDQHYKEVDGHIR